MMFPKENAWRCKKYLKWVGQQPSIISGMPSDEGHHLLGHGFSGSGRAPDWATIPLTRPEHTELHDIGYTAWEEKHGCQLDLLMRFWRKNFEEIQAIITIDNSYM